ncbi:MAG TPA: hypothetical protein VFG11_11270 [Acidobacteriota bacterium]|nr:hypothetical protein [Acidobacteriota bacterium]
MPPANTILVQSFFAKVEEQIHLLQGLIPFIPPEKLLWQPQENTFRLCDILGHLLETLAGFCAALYAVHPDELGHLLKLREKPVNHCCGIDEALQRIHEYQGSIGGASKMLNDSDLLTVISTVFTRRGETLLTILLGNLEHLINHKFQLYFYLKLLRAPVSSTHLYRFRGD